MVGTEDTPIQIDEVYFAGRCKYNCGHLLAGDALPLSEDKDTAATVQSKRNHGARIDGLWVFGLHQGHDCRYSVTRRCSYLSSNESAREGPSFSWTNCQPIAL